MSKQGSRIPGRETVIALLATAGIVIHLVVRFGFELPHDIQDMPLLAVLVLGGLPLVYDLTRKLLRREFGSDLLAGLAIVTAVFLHEYLAGSIVVLMLSGGEALERYAVRHASSVLEALAKRMPSIAHRKEASGIVDINTGQISIGDTIVIFPHEICPVDGEVTEGRGNMDEAYLTGEPYQISKTPGSSVLSGAINGEAALTIRATRLAQDSRYAKIMQVMRASEEQRPQLRRLGDELGAYYTPFAVLVAIAAWIYSGESVRFLSVIMIATPCPLLIAIPIAVIGSISLAARHGIIVRNPAILEQVTRCRTLIFDKTGTLTYGEPRLTEQLCAEGVQERDLLLLVASVERYSKHPLAKAILARAKEAKLTLLDADTISERPGEGLTGIVGKSKVNLTSRKDFLKKNPQLASLLSTESAGLECVVLLDDKYAATYRFRDEPRRESTSFVGHLEPRHSFNRVIIVSGDRESEVRYLADLVGIKEVYAGKSPEEKLEIVRRETNESRTIYVGDGINDAPALMAATVGLAFGQNSDVTSEAAGAVIMESSLLKVDELLHISQRMLSIAMQSAVGGMIFSIIGMGFAAGGMLGPTPSALAQEFIDLFAVLNALRVAWPPKSLTDY